MGFEVGNWTQIYSSVTFRVTEGQLTEAPDIIVNCLPIRVGYLGPFEDVPDFNTAMEQRRSDL